MKPVVPELSRPLQVDRVPNLGSHEKVEADSGELQAISRRLGLPAIHSLKARLHAVPWRGGLKITGKLSADIEQVSVVSLETFRSVVEYPVERYFMPPRATVPEGEEDVDIIEHGEVDIGEMLVEALALELDPYPRMPGESFAAPEDDDESGAGGAFSTLGRLKDK